MGAYYYFIIYSIRAIEIAIQRMIEFNILQQNACTFKSHVHRSLFDVSISSDAE